MFFVCWFYHLQMAALRFKNSNSLFIRFLHFQNVFVFFSFLGEIVFFLFLLEFINEKVWSEMSYKVLMLCDISIYHKSNDLANWKFRVQWKPWKIPIDNLRDRISCIGKRERILRVLHQTFKAYFIQNLLYSNSSTNNEKVFYVTDIKLIIT